MNRPLIPKTIYELKCKKQRFGPEILGPTASSALAVIILEFTIIKLCVYILNITSDVPILDLLAYSGYKFVG